MNYDDRGAAAQARRTFPCAGCDEQLSAPAGFAVGYPRGMAPLCRPCLQRGSDSSVFADLVCGAIGVGCTWPALSAMFARRGLAVPTTRNECAAAAATFGAQ